MLITQYRLVVTDPKGHVKSDSGFLVSHSWTRQFLDILHMHFGNTFGNVTRIDGTPGFVFNTSAQNEMRVNGAFSQINYGPVVGTDDTPEDPTDHALGAQIAHGIGPGQLLHQAADVNPVYLAGRNIWLNTVRSFVNQTGAPIIISEVGLYCLTQLNFYCIIRDLPTIPQTLQDMETLTLTWYLLTTN